MCATRCDSCNNTEYLVLKTASRFQLLTSTAYTRSLSARISIMISCSTGAGCPALLSLPLPKHKHTLPYKGKLAVEVGGVKNVGSLITQKFLVCQSVFLTLCDQFSHFYVDFHTKCENPHIAIVQFSRLGRQFP